MQLKPNPSTLELLVTLIDITDLDAVAVMGMFTDRVVLYWHSQLSYMWLSQCACAIYTYTYVYIYYNI